MEYTPTGNNGRVEITTKDRIWTLIIGALAFAIFVSMFWGVYQFGKEPLTPEQIEAQTKQLEVENKIRQENLEAEHRRDMERIELRNKINRTKPVSVQEQEARNEDFGASEAVTAIGAIAGSTYLISTLLSD